MSLSLAYQRRYIHPHAEHPVRIGVDMHGDGELDIAGVDTMNASGVDRLHHRVDVGVGEVEREATQLKQTDTYQGTYGFRSNKMMVQRKGLLKYIWFYRCWLYRVITHVVILVWLGQCGYVDVPCRSLGCCRALLNVPPAFPCLVTSPT